MATAAEQVTERPRKRIQRRKSQPKLVVVHGQRELQQEQGSALLADIARRMDARRLQARLTRLETRHSHAPDRLSVEKAMLAVEERIVKAYWVLARLPNDKGIGYAKRNGIDYMEEREDRFANAVAAGGKWDQPRPRPATPSGKEIDAMREPLEWLRWLDESEARVLAAGAMWKRGDAGRNVNWNRAKSFNRSTSNFSNDQLKVKYRQALRNIVAELTVRRLGVGHG